MERIIAIINADLVRSSALENDQRARIHRWLASLPSDFERRFGGGEYMVDRFRGDSWQLLVPEAGQALRIALYQQAWLRANFSDLRLRARQGIGIGQHVMDRAFELASADGPAFRRSGAALEASYDGSLLRLAGPEALQGFPEASINSNLALIDELSSRWTGKQAQAVLGALVGETQDEIGRSWPHGSISQQAVGQHLMRAGWTSMAEGLAYFEAWLPSLLGETPAVQA